MTIATNMAGRGTDIVLGGNAEFMAKAQLRKEEVPEEVIAEADGHGDTADEAILRPGPGLRSSPPSTGRRPTGKPRRSRRPAACSSSAPSGTRAAVSTTSCGAVPAVRATRAPAGSS